MTTAPYLLGPISTAEYTLRRMIQPTGNPSDLKSTAYALRLARAEGIYPTILAAVLEARAEWRTQNVLWQRQWQDKTRRPSRALHHDSIAIREKYVRYSHSS